MAKHLDLEEQEQLAQLKHFWQQYGNLISWVLLLVAAGVASWNGYQYWQRNKAAQAGAMYEQLERAVLAADNARIQQTWIDLQQHPRTLQAQQAALLYARVQQDQSKPQEARAALAWVIEKSSDEGYRTMAKLRMAGLLMDDGKLSEALAQLEGNFTGEFAALVADRCADILLQQGQKEQARAAYLQAYKGLHDRADYRRIVEIKLNALGVDPTALAVAPTS